MRNNIYKYLAAVLICMAVVIFQAMTAFAPEGNMDGDGGDMGSGTGTNSWSPGYDGVRVTVIKISTKQAVGTTFDWTSVSPGAYSFVKKNKLQYMSGESLAPIFDEYVYHPAPAGLPQVVSSSGASNIAAVKEYFTDEGRIQAIADDAGISYDTLISGEFIILLEPVAYFKYNGVDYAMTATEAALYDRMVDGNLRSKMGYLTHQNLPLSMYLEYDELGIRAWNGSTGVVSNENILSFLGVGTVKFDELPADPGPTMPGGSWDYTFYTDTDVVVSIQIDNNGNDITPDHNASATFVIPGVGSYSKDYVIPKNESQLVWVKWTTPSAPTTMEIPVNVTRGTPEKSTIRVRIIELIEDTPPDPEGRDRNDGFSLKSPPTGDNVTSLTWGEWWCWWKAKWVWISDGEGGGSWEDQGEWIFEWNSYTSKLQVEAKIFPDDRVPTAREEYQKYTMKSAYGINAMVDVRVETTGGEDNSSQIQHVIAVFPEFDYKTYNRLLIPGSGAPGWAEEWAFKPNEYSQVENPVHFTPLWYPDGLKYPVSFTVLSAWTPAGMLTKTVTADQITIDGNVYQDWHIAPGFGWE